jgi:hypothetical protein
MCWKETDEKLIRRGKLILDPKSLKSHEEEFKTMNKHKRGPHYLLPNSYIQLLVAVRYLYSMPYRQLEGFTRPSTDSCQRSHPATTPASGNASYA